MRPLVGLLLTTALIASPALADNAPLGRLFFTPEQRAAMDRGRHSATSPEREMQFGVKIDGEIRTSSGRSTRWINGNADWTDQARTPDIPVGNTYNPATGEQEQLIGSGQIVIRPGKAGNGKQ